MSNKYLNNLNYEEKEIYKVLEKGYNNLFDVLESDTFITSIYLLKYLNDGDNKYYNLFLEKMNNLNFEERRQVFINVFNNIKEQKNKKEENKHNKVKIKK